MQRGHRPQKLAVAGSQIDGPRAATQYTIIKTANLNGIDPQAYVGEVAEKIAGDWPASPWDELMLWNWRSDLPEDRRSCVGNVAI